ncbi:hypothetical protein SAMN05443999_105279 [Roseovarius azorensis]|uniref:Uncharacterized protein n=2 Tax=Roseovarius azorensis TaxID=1287727 RepID=A0A1H7QIQ2_9RHOB|nr:hypothetical protein SAMN05443999_105279 [Roseovarius azorensis]
MGMDPEPYRFQPSSVVKNSTDTLVRHAEEVVAGAYPSWQWLYEKLETGDSRNMLLTVLAYRTIGWKHVEMPLDTPAFWAKLDELSDLQIGRTATDSLETGVNGIVLSRFELERYGFDIEIFSDAFGIFNEFPISLSQSGRHHRLQAG